MYHKPHGELDTGEGANLAQTAPAHSFLLLLRLEEGGVELLGVQCPKSPQFPATFMGAGTNVAEAAPCQPA